jgi:hypothetical protein
MALLAGTPDPRSAPLYPLTVTASNGVAPDATQTFLLRVSLARLPPAQGLRPQR